MTPTRMNLHRRYPDRIIRRRTTDSGPNTYGEWVEGTVTETELYASVQPLALEDRDLEEGSRLRHRLKVFVPADSGDLRAAFDQEEADRVTWQGVRYVVEESRTWPRFTRATIIRET